MPGKGVILLVEDNEQLNRANARALKLRGYEVHAALTLQAARELLSRIAPDMILLDVMLPDGDGFDFCAGIRGCVNAHILFLTGKTEHGDMVRGLTGGGDDYITKPFHPEELMARIESAMRRRDMDNSAARTLTKGNLTLDILAGLAMLDGTNIDLSPKEFAVLLLLARNEGKLLSAEAIYENVWKAGPVGYKTAIQHVISRLRVKLAGTDYGIATGRGADAGYMFTRE